MNRKLNRTDFIIKDLVISVGGSSRGSTWLPGPDDETPPSPISPIASVLVNLDIIESVRATIIDAIESGKGFESIAQAFVAGETGGNAAIRSAIQEIGTAVIASAAYSALGRGSAGMPNPDCGGSSLETIPTPITPVINIGRNVHRITELPRLKQQLSATTRFIDKAVDAQAPKGEEIAAVRAELEGALKSLG